MPSTIRAVSPIFIRRTRLDATSLHAACTSTILALHKPLTCVVASRQRSTDTVTTRGDSPTKLSIRYRDIFQLTDLAGRLARKQTGTVAGNVPVRSSHIIARAQTQALRPTTSFSVTQALFTSCRSCTFRWQQRTRPAGHDTTKNARRDLLHWLDRILWCIGGIERGARIRSGIVRGCLEHKLVYPQ